MKALISTAAFSAALLLAGCGEGGDGGNSSTASAAAPAAIPAPNGGDWTQTVTQSPAGGFVMGNPNAPVKLVEYASMTCSHCAEFSETGAQPLIDKYVKSGQVSFEIRNFVRDPADLAAALLARCSGPGPFFQLTDQMFAAQEQWIGRLQEMPPAMQQQMSAMSPQQAVPAVAEQAGLIQFARVRGVPAEKAQQCLTNQAEIDRLVQMQQQAVKELPNFPGTPTFTINGEMVENAGTWALLEPKIQDALS
jgi:protein-disulfide isomerase